MNNRRHILAAIMIATLLPAGAATAAQKAAAQKTAAQKAIRDEGVFDFYVRGFRVGILVFAGVRTKDYYAVNGRFSTAGLAEIFRSVSYHATVQGRILKGRLVPQVYKLDVDRGREKVHEEMRYRNGVPGAITRNPPRPPDPLAVAPATQAGTLDTLSAIYATMQRMPAAGACSAEINLYDGTRRARLTLWPADSHGSQMTCGGEYRRVAGYSAKDMAHPAFPFTMRLQPLADGKVQVSDVEMDSIYGKASLKRR